MKRTISRLRRWLDRRQEAKSLQALTEFEILLLNSSYKYRAARPYIYGVIGRREN
jgi:hypothetical protein